MGPPRDAEPRSIEEGKAPVQFDFKFKPQDMDIYEDVEAELEDFVRLARLELYDLASQWFETCLSKYQSMFPVLVEQLDMLLQTRSNSSYQDVVEILDSKIQKDPGKTLAAHDETNPDDESQLLASMETLAKARLETLEADELIAALEDYRRYLGTKSPQDTSEGFSAIRIHLVEVYLGIVMVALELPLITEQEKVRYKNPPWTTEGAPEWSGFCAWYTDLRKTGYHWEAQRIQSILLPQVTFEEAEKTFIQAELSEFEEHTEGTGEFDESLVLSMLVMSNTVCAYLLKDAVWQPHLVNLASTYLTFSRSLKAELSRNSTLDIIDEGRPLKRVDKLRSEYTNRATRGAVGGHLPHVAAITDSSAQAAPNMTPEYEVKLLLKPTAVLGPNGELVSTVLSTFDVPPSVTKQCIQFLDTSSKDIYAAGWSARIHKTENDYGLELTYKKRYAIVGDDIDAALTTANKDGFDAGNVKYEAKVEWGYQKQTLSISRKKSTDSMIYGMDLPEEMSSRSMLIEEAPTMFDNWVHNKWGTGMLAKSRIFGPVCAKRYVGKWEGTRIYLEVWPTLNAEATGHDYLVEASFKTESRMTASTKHDSFISYLQDKGWLLCEDSPKTQLIMERY